MVTRCEIPEIMPTYQPCMRIFALVNYQNANDKGSVKLKSSNNYRHCATEKVHYGYS